MGSSYYCQLPDNDFENNTFRYNSSDVSTNGKLVLNTFDQNYWDKYEGYDLDRNGMGDVPFTPSVFLPQL